MKKRIKNAMLLVPVLLLCTALVARGQTHNWYTSLFRFLKPDQSSTIKGQFQQNRVVEKQNKSELVIHNINRHLKEVAKLRAQGKTEEEICEYFNAQRKAVGTGSISGTVYESDGVTPVQNFLRIETYDAYGEYVGSKYITSRDSGAYSISKLPAGDYYVRTSSSDYYINEYYDNVTDWRQATLVPITDGQETSGINFILDHYEGAISGRVISIGGAHLSECSIAAYDENDMWTGIGSGQTDENGLYVVSGLPTGAYKLQVDYWGTENYTGEWYDNTQSFETACVITVAEPETTKGINFMLDYGGAIAGRVFNAKGAPVDAYECQIAAFDAEENWINSVPTDENGNCVITKLPTGNYKLYAEYFGEDNNVDVWYDGAEDFESATLISVTVPDTTKNVNITLRAAGAISGRVYGPEGQLLETADGLMTVYDEYQNKVTGGQILENGIYIMSQLPTGHYKLFYEYRRHTQIVGHEAASEWYDGVYNFEDATLVEVAAPDTTSNINFTLQRGGYIGGQVYSPEGQLLSYSGNIEAFNLKEELIQQSSILNEGRYFLTGLPTGEYKLKMNYAGQENYFDEWYNGKLFFETADCVRVTMPNMTPNINFTLEHAGFLQGYVTDAAGKRLSDDEHSINIFIYDANSGEYIDSEDISFVGGYQFELLAKRYKVAAASFYINALSKHDSLAVAYYEHGTRFHDPSTQTISLLPDSSLKLNDLVMQKVSGTVSGMVYDKGTGQPMVEGLYFIFAFDADGYLAKYSAYLSDPSHPITGEYLLCGLRPGNYYLLALVEPGLAQWYAAIDTIIDLETFTPKPNIPATASAVTVGEGLISGINFYFNMTDVDKERASTTAQRFELRQNYPNPFNPITRITYMLQRSNFVTLKIYDLLGREVQTLVSEFQNAGDYSVCFDGSHFSSGLYFYQLKAGNEFVATKKMVVIR